MSATNRGAPRAENDFYETPAAVTHAILPYIPRGGVVFDPCCGNGAILKAVEADYGAYIGMDVDETRVDYCDTMLNGIFWHYDALVESWPKAGVCIMNPPFSKAFEFVQKAEAWTREHGSTAAVLLRLNFLGSRKRSEFMRRSPPDVYVITPRPSFADGKNDATEYAWMVWGPGRGGRWAVLETGNSTPK